MQHLNRLYTLLIAAGVLPFIFAALASALSIKAIPFIANIKEAGALYGLVIVSFMAGAHWGICIASNSEVRSSDSTKLMLASNAYAIFPWLLYLLFGTSSVFFIALIIAFTLIFISDHFLYKQSVISQHYYQTRRWVTIVVLAALTLSACT